MKKTDKRQLTIAICFIAVVCFSMIGSFWIFAKNAQRVQRQDAINTLNVAAETARNLVTQSIESNFETLTTLSSFIGYNYDPTDGPDLNKMMNTLNSINSQNSFLRMGFVSTDYLGNFVHLDGSFELDVNLSTDAAVQSAMNGNPAVSFTFWDEALQAYVNRYAVPVYENGIAIDNNATPNRIIGVLCGSNPSDAFRSLLDDSLFSQGGYAHITTNTGRFVIRNVTYFVEKDARNLFDSNVIDEQSKEILLNAFHNGDSATAEVESNGTLYEMVFLPLQTNDWYIVCVAPQEILVSDILQWFNLQRTAFYVLFALLAVFAGYVYGVLQKSNRSMHKLAYFDPIVGCYNRTKFLEELQARLTDTSKALVILSIDNSDTVKNLYGMATFNQMLQYIKTCCDTVLASDSLFGLGRNEHFLILLNYDTKEPVQWRLQKLFELISQFQVTEHQNFPLICSAGVRFINTEDTDIENAITQAAMSMESALKIRNHEIIFFDQSIYDPEILRSKIEENMESALKNEEFEMKLQPKINLHTGKLSSAEALVRWPRPDGTMFFPDQFIPVFEKNGFCVDLDFYMVDQACRQLRKWMEEGIPVVPISVNQCRLMFYTDNYVERLCQILQRWSIPSNLIILEVTEGLALDDVHVVRNVLWKLHSKGFSISMDDFGSGFSSLNTLKDLPIDELKLDRMFLSTTDYSDEQKRDLILKNIIQLANDLEITTVMEGVESADQVEFMRSMKCDIVQGYYYDKPLSTAEFEEKYFRQ